MINDIFYTIDACLPDFTLMYFVNIASDTFLSDSLC